MPARQQAERALQPTPGPTNGAEREVGERPRGFSARTYASGRRTTGLVVSHSIGEGGYRGETSGEIEATVTALTP